MNIFFLHKDPKKASLYHVDKHVVKMPLETAQILCTVNWISGLKAPYKPTHTKHTCVLWATESTQNYLWLCSFGKYLCQEYTFRYGKKHASEAIIDWCYSNIPNLPVKRMTQPHLAMPDEFKVYNDPVKSYRNYYKIAKSHLHSWKNRPIPNFIKNNKQ